MAFTITVPSASVAMASHRSAFAGKPVKTAAPRATAAAPKRHPRVVETRCSGLMASPSALPVLAVCATVPTCLGFFKQEYAVSYGYAGAMASSGLVALLGGGLEPVATAHAALLLLYGLRLGAFLLWRELSIERFRKFTEKIEAKAPADRLKRLPWVVTCSLLYLGMASPVVVSARQAPLLAGAPLLVAKVALAAALVGGLVEAVGDLQKSFYKSQDPDKWVDKGLFAILRHPNYQGEQLLWVGSLVCAVACAWGSLANVWGWVVGGLLGTAGIQMVLMMATTGLERRQGESYGSDPAFQAYRESTWGGFTLPPKKDGGSA